MPTGTAFESTVFLPRLTRIRTLPPTQPSALLSSSGGTSLPETLITTPPPWTDAEPDTCTTGFGASGPISVTRTSFLRGAGLPHDDAEVVRGGRHARAGDPAVGRRPAGPARVPTRHAVPLSDTAWTRWMPSAAKLPQTPCSRLPASWKRCDCGTSAGPITTGALNPLPVHVRAAISRPAAVPPIANSPSAAAREVRIGEHVHAAVGPSQLLVVLQVAGARCSGGTPRCRTPSVEIISGVAPSRPIAPRYGLLVAVRELGLVLVLRARPVERHVLEQLALGDGVGDERQRVAGAHHRVGERDRADAHPSRSSSPPLSDFQT